MKATFNILLLCFFAGATLAQAPKWADLSYANDTLTGHRLDIYLPENGAAPYPVIVTIAGSAWFGNNTKERAYNRIGKPLHEEGYAVVAVNHRSSREAIWPAQINDIKAAVRFIRANAGKYQLDTTFVGITGDSSGGHLSAMMGLTGGVERYSIGSQTIVLEGSVGEFLDANSKVDAVVDWYGPSVFQKMDSCGSSFSHDAPESPESTLIGGPIQDNDDLCALANPITYIDSSDPSFLVLHGNKDMIVPHCQGVFLHEALERNDVQSDLIIVDGGEHGPGMWEKEYIDRMISFFNSERTKKKK